ncbi:MAG TPA: MCE family protein, partial [Marmoricola sp.]|nr:MCE family protein [Marmoricola sp.]
MNRRRLVLGLIVVVLAAAGWFGYRASRPTQITLTAQFADTTGLYVGNQVQYLGVPIGHVTSITPEGPYMAVHMQIDHGSTIPKDAGAQIMQSALLTDRYVDLGPAYTNGPLLASGAIIDLKHTRSPINIDDLSRAVDSLVSALSTPGATSPKTSSVGQLVHAVAGQLDGNGSKVHDLLVSSQKALQTLNTNSPDIAAITNNLAELTNMLRQRDRDLHNFGTGVSQATAALASQGPGLSQTITAFAQLTDQVQTFVKANGSTLVADLAKAAGVASTVHAEQADLARIFDLMPTGAENIVRAFDPSLGAIRVALAARGQTIFSSIMRSATCTAYLGTLCSQLMNTQGTGPLDQIFNGA